MYHGLIRITRRPHGEAPPEVRDQWIGLVLPSIGKAGGENIGLLSGRAAPVSGGYRVRWEDAMKILGSRSPETREWWETHVNPIVLTFDDQCCEVLPD